MIWGWVQRVIGYALLFSSGFAAYRWGSGFGSALATLGGGLLHSTQPTPFPRRPDTDRGTKPAITVLPAAEAASHDPEADARTQVR